MASFNRLPNTEPRFESPAKVFAKLKSKVQKEAMCAKEGFFASKDIPCNIRGKPATEFHSPRKKAASSWAAGELKENQRFSSYRNEVQPLTLSPISSPQKPFDYTCSVVGSRPLVETSPGNQHVRGFSRGDGAVMESTAVSQPMFSVIRDQIRSSVSSRTPVKIQPVESYGKNDFDVNCGPLSKPVSPGNGFSPMKKRLRKRKWEQQEFSAGRTTKERNENIQPLQGRKTSALVEDYTHNNSCMQGLGTVRLSSNQPEILQESVLSPKSALEKCPMVVQETYPIMSPAKVFAYMKERENKKERQEVDNSSKRDLFGRGSQHHSGGTPPSTAHNVGEVKDSAFGGALERMVSVSLCRVDSTDFLSDAERSEDVFIPAAAPQLRLLEDPLVLNSPQISIPKTQEPVFKRNCGSKQNKFPLEDVIYLKKWFLRKNQKGLFVDGIHKELNIPWNSNLIVDRISSSVLRTVSGRVYILVGKMKIDVASDFPNWLLKKFASGFPSNWKALYEHFLQKSREANGNNEQKVNKAQTNPESSSINQSVNRHKKKTTRTPEVCTPTSSSSTKVSRSGRIIKPPLDYWKGGRVILDAHMNVTIHECYNSSPSEISTIVSPRTSQKPVRAIVPSVKGWKQSESDKDEKTSVPSRRVNAGCKKPAAVAEAAVEMLSSHEEWCGRTTRSRQRRLHPAAERGLHVSAAPQKQSQPSAHRAKQQRPSGRKRSVPASPTVSNKTERPSSDEKFNGKRKKRAEQVLVQKQPERKAPSNWSPGCSEEGRRAQRKRTGGRGKSDEAQTQHVESKSTKRPAKTSLKPKQSSQKDHPDKGSAVPPQDEDKWSEAELMLLQEAVSYYPKNIPGYWANVARTVGTRSAEECYRQHSSLGASHTPAKRAAKKAAAPKPPAAECPVISARVGTFKRKQQVRQFLESQPRDDVDDAFSSAYMQNKQFEIPSMCPSDDCDFQLDPQTPMSSHFPEIKTPRCLHITPGMMGSPNANGDDKYVYQLQRRMKKNQCNVIKNSPSSRKFTPTPSLKRRMRRCGNMENDTFVVWEMLAENDDALSESGEEDFYFSDN